MPKRRLSRREMFLLATPLLGVVFLFFCRFLYNRGRMSRAEANATARRLAGSRAMDCGYVKQIDTTAFWDAVDACTIRAHKEGKPFIARYESPGDFGSMKEYTTVRTPQGKIFFLQYNYRSVPNERVKLYVNECPNVQIYIRNGLTAPKFLACP